MAATGKTGADAMFRFLHMACGTLKRYRSKLEAVIRAAQAAGAITAEQAQLMLDFIGNLSLLCVAFEALSKYSGV